MRNQIVEGTDLSDVDYSDLVHIEELDMDDPSGEQMDPLTAEQTDFLTAIEQNGKIIRMITTNDIEIHVRQPIDHRAKARLAAMARSLNRIMSGEKEA